MFEAISQFITPVGIVSAIIGLLACGAALLLYRRERADSKAMPAAAEPSVAPLRPETEEPEAVPPPVNAFKAYKPNPPPAGE